LAPGVLLYWVERNRSQWTNRLPACRGEPHVEPIPLSEDRIDTALAHLEERLIILGAFSDGA